MFCHCAAQMLPTVPCLGFVMCCSGCMLVQVAEEIWVCNKRTVTKWDGDIFSYKESLVKLMEKDKSRKK